MRTTLLKVTAFLALTGIVVMAQHGNPPDRAKMAQHRIDFLTKQLSLTPQQQQQAATIFGEIGNNAKATHDQMRTAHNNLKAAIQKNDTAAIEQAANTIGSLNTQMVLAHAKTQAAFYQILTPEQQAKMNDLESSHRRGMGWRRHGFGHGGPDGPPPGPGASF
jgi:Spy/CpxP family protein refolding chaperone